jgi:VCBS repeat-containing protein
VSVATELLRRSSRLPPALVAVAAMTVVVLLLALVLTTFARGQIHTGATSGMGTATAESTSAGTAPAAPEATSSPTAPGNSGGSTGGGAGTGIGGTGGIGAPTTPPLSNVPLHVNGISITLDRTTYVGTCSDGMPFTATVTLTVDPSQQGGEVQYQWLYDDNTDPNVQTLSFGPSQTMQTMTHTFFEAALNGDGSPHWVAVQVTGQNTLTSAQAAYNLKCIRQYTGISGSATPASWSAPCGASQTFDFTFTSAITHGPDATASWAITESSGFTSADGLWHAPSGTTPLLASFDGSYGTATQPLKYDFSYLALPATAPNGDYWLTLTITGPDNSSATQTLHVTKNC